MVVLLCLTPLFRNMPQNAQAAIIISAVAGLFNISEAIFLWKVRTSWQAAVPIQAVRQAHAWPYQYCLLWLRCLTGCYLWQASTCL